MIFADSAKITDWWQAIASTVSIFVTAGVAVAIAIYSSGYRMRIRAWRDCNGVVRVHVFNRGRIDGEVESVELAVRPGPFSRVARRIFRKQKVVALVTVVASPTRAETIKPGHTGSWQLLGPTAASSIIKLPKKRHPLTDFQDRPLESKEVEIMIDCGVYRTRYLSHRAIRDVPHEFDEYEAGIFEELVRRGQVGDMLAMGDMAADNGGPAMQAPGPAPAARRTHPNVAEAKPDIAKPDIPEPP